MQVEFTSSVGCMWLHVAACWHGIFMLQCEKHQILAFENIQIWYAYHCISVFFSLKVRNDPTVTSLEHLSMSSKLLQLSRSHM